MSIEHFGKWEDSIQVPHFGIFIASGFHLNKTFFFLDYIFFVVNQTKSSMTLGQSLLTIIKLMKRLQNW